MMIYLARRARIEARFALAVARADARWLAARTRALALRVVASCPFLSPEA